MEKLIMGIWFKEARAAKWTTTQEIAPENFAQEVANIIATKGKTDSVTMPDEIYVFMPDGEELHFLKAKGHYR